jgi:hypothetical protein
VSRVSEASSGSTSLIGAANLSPVTMLGEGTGPEVSGVQVISEPEICQGTGFKLRADARFAQRSGAKLGVRVQEPLQVCLECRSTCLPAGKQKV